MRLRLIVLLTVFCAVFGYGNSKEINEEKIGNLQKQIEFLQQKKKEFEAKETYHMNQGDRLQFKDGELQEAKRHWKLAEFNKKMAGEMQTKINELEQEKQKLLKK